MRKIVIMTSDDHTYKLDVDIVKRSETITQMLTGFRETKGAVQTIPLDVKEDIFSLILDWLNYHRDETLPDNYGEVIETLSDWDQHFVQMPRGMFDDLLIT